MGGARPAVQVYDGGVDVPQVDNPGVTISLLMQDGVGADEEEDASAHDQGPQHLQPIRVQVPAEATGGEVSHCPTQGEDGSERREGANWERKGEVQEEGRVHREEIS